MILRRKGVRPMTNIYTLRNIGLPVIRSIDDLATYTKLSSSKINKLSYSSAHMYKEYTIPKISGGVRVIAQPSRELKAIQAWILRNILDKLKSTSNSKGFELGSSILDNAKPHIGSNYILNVDLEDFFPSISANKVYTIFYSLGYDKKICFLLTNFCVYKGALPQGAPSSPKLANLICSKLDLRIQSYAGPRGLTYTRYADDITISANTSKKIPNAHEFIETVIRDEGFRINKKKTLISGVRKRKVVTGLVVNQSTVGIGRAKYKEIRAAIHYLYIGKTNDYNKINGLIAFVYSVDKKMYHKIVHYVQNLSKSTPNSIFSESMQCLRNNQNKRVVVDKNQG